jgi:hypothetical protein
MWFMISQEWNLFVDGETLGNCTEKWRCINYEGIEDLSLGTLAQTLQ